MLVSQRNKIISLKYWDRWKPSDLPNCCWYPLRTPYASLPGRLNRTRKSGRRVGMHAAQMTKLISLEFHIHSGTVSPIKDQHVLRHRLNIDNIHVRSPLTSNLGSFDVLTTAHTAALNMKIVSRHAPQRYRKPTRSLDQVSYIGRFFFL